MATRVPVLTPIGPCTCLTSVLAVSGHCSQGRPRTDQAGPRGRGRARPEARGGGGERDSGVPKGSPILYSQHLPYLTLFYHNTIPPTPSLTPTRPSPHSAAMVDGHEDELTPEQTEGFKVGEKKTIDEYQQLEKKNNNLQKYGYP
ncbi:uncharacterized protein J3D65DRAFT_315386 [Phyllosticta citribraziliensis]|uniref:Uncharacterized protein n=1 Tax=Phyllosticta citribraziliensis TaxID=989973 RepID=A0ABR1LSF8_9PEZI